MLALFLLAPYAQSGSEPVTARSDRFEVDSLDEGGDGRPARVMITDRQTSRRHLISINSTLGRLQGAKIRSDEQRVVLVCENGFAVVDPRGLVPADEVYARHAVPSPDAAWIAYERFYPATHPGPSAAVALYDTRKSREENHAAYPAAGERAWHAGWAIYPPAAEWKEAAAVTPRDSAYQLSSLLMWLGDPSRPALVFTMHHESVDTLVVADPSADPTRVCTVPLPGAADAWRVKTITLTSGPSDDREVHVQSRAIGADAPSATFVFPRGGCQGSTGR
jgi:hypothetical protein